MGDSSLSSAAEVLVLVEPFAVGEEVGMWIFPTEETKATISMLWASLRYFSAMAPAATRPGTVSARTRRRAIDVRLRGGVIPIVSRAELRPPPLLAFTPYFWR